MEEINHTEARIENNMNIFLKKNNNMIILLLAISRQANTNHSSKISFNIDISNSES